MKDFCQNVVALSLVSPSCLALGSDWPGLEILMAFSLLVDIKLLQTILDDDIPREKIRRENFHPILDDGRHRNYLPSPSPDGGSH